ncbi:hypothetical protein VTN02DRAFT_5822 [Thermoascus thermophilus]
MAVSVKPSSICPVTDNASLTGLEVGRRAGFCFRTSDVIAARAHVPNRQKQTESRSAAVIEPQLSDGRWRSNCSLVFWSPLQLRFHCPTFPPPYPESAILHLIRSDSTSEPAINPSIRNTPSFQLPLYTWTYFLVRLSICWTRWSQPRDLDIERPRSPS